MYVIPFKKGRNQSSSNTESDRLILAVSVLGLSESEGVHFPDKI